jgi:hypothetical protein
MATEALPMIFNLRGVKPDTKLKAFTKEFHVHSLVLKQHSAIFHKFMDSVDKIPRSGNADFRYEYITKIDADDGTWTLGAASDQKVREGQDAHIVTLHCIQW